MYVCMYVCKTTEKLTKYKDLEIEVERTWGLKTATVPVFMGALGTIKKDMENYSNKIPGNVNTHELQKITPLSTAHLLRRVLSIKVETLFASDVEREN